MLKHTRLHRTPFKYKHRKPKGQLPSKLMIEMILHNFAGMSNSINTDEFESLAKAIKELYEKV